jgi:hypothetical protein
MNEVVSLRARGVQKQDVFAAADALIGEGQRPTIERVRLKMGRGSPNTVSPLLDQWFATLGPRLTGAAAPAGETGEVGVHREEGLPSDVRQAAQALWEVAQRRAGEAQRAQLSADAQALENEKAALSEAQVAMAQREAAFEEARTRLDAALAASREAQDALERRLAEVTAEAGEARRALEGQVQHLGTQLAQAAERQERVRAEHAQALAARDQDLRLAAQRHVAEGKRMQGEVDRARQATKAFEAELARTQQRLQKSEEVAATRLHAQQEHLVGERDSALAAGSALREQLGSARESLAALQTDAAVAREQGAAAHQRLEDERQAHEATRALLVAALQNRAPETGPAGDGATRGKRSTRSR